MNLKVSFNVPNSIGYFRLILLLVSMLASDLTFIILYGLSSALDFADGYTARMFNQCSKLGSCLDMITDRTSTVLISLRIVQKKSEYSAPLGLYLVLDLLSHFIYFNSSALMGTHHKKATNRILRIYYSPCVLNPICLLSELFFMCLYYTNGPNVLTYWLSWIAVMKSLFHLAQLFEAISVISEVKCEETKKSS